ncbi:MAG TPA: pyrroloquinoline quinone biosynthesis protein PqqB [Polyangia bacterium]|nr:pyrroloquinoline quinone biosynthesis protein PqqB [Polyangia bacterium]
MRIRVLGSAAGGGFPQWNCGCENCQGVRAGRLKATARTQESLAVSADGEAWFLINASPEIRQQIESFPGLWPRKPRHSPIAGIILTNGDMDHVLGLLSLRESHPLTVYATESVRRGFSEGNVLYRTLERFPGQLTWVTLRAGVSQPLLIGGERSSGLTVMAVPAPGKRPLHLEGPGTPPPVPEDNIGVVIAPDDAAHVVGGRRGVAYFAAAAGRSPAVDQAVAGVDCVFFDGTFWSSDELIAAGLGTRRAEDMAHWPVGGPQGSLSWLSGGPARRKILIHVNNTNPVLRDDGPERAAASAAGVEIAYDGMELTL